MKIGVFSNFYPPMERGGAELIAQRVADELSRRGHEVFVLSTMPFSGVSSLRIRETEHHVARIYRFFPFNLYHLSHASSYPFPARLLWHALDTVGPFPHARIDRLLEKEEPDVVLTHNLKGLGVRAARCVQDAGIRHIHTLHDVQLSVPSGLMIYGKEGGFLNQGWPRRLYERATIRALGSPDVVISPSKFLSDFYAKRGFFSKTTMRILPNPAPKSLSVIAPSSQFPSGPTRFLFVGQLEVHKGIRLLLEAMAKLDRPYELHVIGDGSLAREIAKQATIDSRLFFHGFISLEHIKKLMTKSDAVIVPSLCYENSPTVIYESFQMGLPVIASRIGGISELVTDGKNGLLVEPGSLEALRLTLERFILERELFWSRREEIKKNAEQYSLQRYVDELETMFI